MSIEQPKFHVLEGEDNLQIRQYQPSIIAKTVVESSDMDKASNEGFRRIAKFIFGDNTAKGKIAMTAPVTSSEERSEKIAMTAPVSMQVTGGKYVIAFTMPSSYTLVTLPSPNDDRVKIEQLPGKKMAVIKYSGTWSPKRMQEKKDELLNWLREKKLKPIGEVIFARYDPPWTPWFMRTNEVQVEVE
ncbi:MAG: heme-binding protein [bacterium]